MMLWLEKQWMRFTCWHLLLLPVSWLFALLSATRRQLYKIGFLKSHRLGVPVIVVGNINVGGTGKTPLVIWLVEQLKLAGYCPGVVSRGYGGNVRQVTEVKVSSLSSEVGDEPLLIALRSGCPVFVSSNRVNAAEALLNAYPACNVVVSDDGLQHYRMQRDVEIVVYDGAKRFGNGALLPAGPLRESIARLKMVDAIVCNGQDFQVDSQENLACFEMQLEATDFYNLVDAHVKCDAKALQQKKIWAVAGIGNPERFFLKLQQMGLAFERRAFTDHYAFQESDFSALTADVVVMTEKDAVKCKFFAHSNFWVLPVNAVIENDLMAVVLSKLNRKKLNGS